MYICINIYWLYLSACSCARVHTHTHAHDYTDIHTHACTHPGTLPAAKQLIHSHACTHICTHSHTHPGAPPAGQQSYNFPAILSPSPPRSRTDIPLKEQEIIAEKAAAGAYTHVRTHVSFGHMFLFWNRYIYLCTDIAVKEQGITAKIGAAGACKCAHMHMWAHTCTRAHTHVDTHE